MIIWGSTGREKVLEQGDFYCPACDGQFEYRHVRASRYFTLYFIPLFQLQNLGEYIECEECGQCFDVEVLDYEGPTPEEKLLVFARKAVGSGMPLHMVLNKLTKRGLDEPTAKGLVRDAVGEETVKCSGCGFAYGPSVSECSNCGMELGSFWL